METYYKVFHTGGPVRGGYCVGEFNSATRGYLRTLSRHKFSRDADISKDKAERARRN